jgi:anti-sigma regulatory factor (Ser/Thr protein kinase)
VHARAPRDSEISLAAGLVGDTLHVAVTDHGNRFEMRRAAPDSAGGYGFQLLELEAARWGVDRSEATRVWFEL